MKISQIQEQVARKESTCYVSYGGSKSLTLGQRKIRNCKYNTEYYSRLCTKTTEKVFLGEVGHEDLLEVMRDCFLCDTVCPMP